MWVMRCPTLRRSGTANSSATASAAASTTHTIAVRRRRPCEATAAWSASAAAAEESGAADIGGGAELVDDLEHLAVVGDAGDERARRPRGLAAGGAHELQIPL